MTIYEGESLDRYGDPDEDAKALEAERVDWRRVPVADLHDRSSALCYMDAEGLRFYTPAIMSTIVRNEDHRGLLTDSFLFHLHGIRKSCRVGDAPYFHVHNSGQRAAIVRFVKYLIHNVPGDIDEALVTTLEGLQRCTRHRDVE